MCTNNYFFGINQGYRNKNIKKFTKRISPRKRIRSALLISRDKRIFNEEEVIYKIQKDNNVSNIINSKYFPRIRLMDNSRWSASSQNEKINQKNEIKINESKKEINIMRPSRWRHITCCWS